MTVLPSLAFPGAIFDARGRSLDSLRQEDLDAYPHRFLVTANGSAVSLRRGWRKQFRPLQGVDWLCSAMLCWSSR